MPRKPCNKYTVSFCRWRNWTQTGLWFAQGPPGYWTGQWWRGCASSNLGLHVLNKYFLNAYCVCTPSRSWRYKFWHGLCPHATFLTVMLAWGYIKYSVCVFSVHFIKRVNFSSLWACLGQLAPRDRNTQERRIVSWALQFQSLFESLERLENMLFC